MAPEQLAGHLEALGGQEHLAGKRAKFNVLFCVLARDRAFRVAFGGVSVTVYRACAQKLASDRGEGGPATLMDVFT